MHRIVVLSIFHWCMSLFSRTRINIAGCCSTGNCGGIQIHNINGETKHVLLHVTPILSLGGCGAQPARQTGPGKDRPTAGHCLQLSPTQSVCVRPPTDTSQCSRARPHPPSARLKTQPWLLPQAKLKQAYNVGARFFRLSTRKGQHADDMRR